MKKIHNDFFREKKDWSKIKDKILGYYLKPYFNKIMASRKEIYFFDCFAGEGIFGGDSVNLPFLKENYGSPLIALNCFEEAMRQSNYKDFYKDFYKDKNYMFYFSDNHCGEKLKQNIENSRFNVLNWTVEQNDYKETIYKRFDEIKNKVNSVNMFFYIDPFGIKDLNIDIIKDICEMSTYSLEFLINFNVNGFFRNACKINKIEIKKPDLEYLKTHTIEDNSLDKNKSESTLSKIIGTNEWKSIIQEYKNDEKNILYRDVEKSLVNLYRNSLRKALGKDSYAINIPIKDSDTEKSKYNLVFATRHYAGAYIMGNDMAKHDEIMWESINNGQLNLFTTQDNQCILISDIKENIKSLIDEMQEVQLEKFVARFYDRYTLIKYKELKTVIKELENDYLKIIKQSNKKIICKLNK